jgi:lipoprotein-releasing system ATP-binding protein
MRNVGVGFVFQFHHLLREFTALENVMMPCLIAGRQRKASEARAQELLTLVGLGERMSHRSSQLSGGEQQRVAVARALSAEPPLLLADEPSGNLDTQTSGELHNLLFHLQESQRLGMVLVTHNPELAGRADRILELKDGRLHEAGRA